MMASPPAVLFARNAGRKMSLFASPRHLLCKPLQVHVFLRQRNRPAPLAGGSDAKAEPTVTAEELYANLADQSVQLRRLHVWLDVLSGWPWASVNRPTG